MPTCTNANLSACKKWTPFLTSFLRYCKDIENAWSCPSIMIVICRNLQETLSLLSMLKINFTPSFLIEILHRHSKLAILGTLGMLDHSIKIMVSIWSKLSCLSIGKNSTLTAWGMLFWRYCKDMQTSYFGCFEHASSRTPKMIVSICRR